MAKRIAVTAALILGLLLTGAMPAVAAEPSTSITHCLAPDGSDASSTVTLWATNPAGNPNRLRGLEADYSACAERPTHVLAAGFGDGGDVLFIDWAIFAELDENGMVDLDKVELRDLGLWNAQMEVGSMLGGSGHPGATPDWCQSFNDPRNGPVYVVGADGTVETFTCP